MMCLLWNFTWLTRLWDSIWLMFQEIYKYFKVVFIVMVILIWKIYRRINASNTSSERIHGAENKLWQTLQSIWLWRILRSIWVFIIDCRISRTLWRILRSIWSTQKVEMNIFGERRTYGAGRVFLSKLSHKLRCKGFSLSEVNDSDFKKLLLVFCPVVSRIGTDINAVLSETKDFERVILVVMHHTPNPQYIFTDSTRFIESPNVILTVDCLFHEKQFLLECESNEVALEKISTCLTDL
ncbi:uncharacterized protein LOC120526125 isoform X2 [Polypterus senegalus]|uniref:uncharacterized protein LOC120526125 isoform X2 n=1 Tax=Polypterus senegalus TaxID=55291 RepID=UPI001965F793|nr:uncharacterized protein LOC120526125 isoform X2 [Polypterus senegalus]